MFVGLTNTPRPYSWGTEGEIADLLGRTAPGGPQAEYWLGTHPGSPAHLVPVAGGDDFGDATTIDQLVTLPFIMKVLSAATSLSLQAHPSSAQAEAGFARENEAGISLDAENRNYKDSLHKPELIYALSDEFEALCGFRPVAATRALVETLGPDPLVDAFAERLVDDESLRDVFEWLISGGSEVSNLRARVLDLAQSSNAPEFATVVRLSQQFPSDVGILLSLLLNLVTLRAGEAIYLPSGNIHAYQRGLGIEVLAASDNVLRGGLTPKYVDVPELLRVVDFRPLPVPYLLPERPGDGIAVFRPDVPDFELAVIRPSEAHGAAVSFAPPAEFVALCAFGALIVSGAKGEKRLAVGEAFFATADEGPIRVSGQGTLFVATTNPAADQDF